QARAGQAGRPANGHHRNHQSGDDQQPYSHRSGPVGTQKRGHGRAVGPLLGGNWADSTTPPATLRLPAPSTPCLARGRGAPIGPSVIERTRTWAPAPANSSD